jgi:hypothetical protein
MMNASFPDRSREHWTEPVPPEPNSLVADIDALNRSGFAGGYFV